MVEQIKSEKYRDLVDHLVEMCQQGQGRIGASRVKSGVWNANASPSDQDDQHLFNVILGRLGQADRDVIAIFMQRQVELGVFETLKALEEFQVAPFEYGYEGSAFHDFAGRLDGWSWPNDL